MKRYLLSLSVAAVVLLLNITNTMAAMEVDMPKRKVSTQIDSQTKTFVVTIVEIDTATNKVVLKDRSGKIWEFVIDSKYGIDLTQFKAGDTVRATISTAASTNPELRAKISKAELIRLQKN